jgi:hypothetical protein
LVELVGEVNIPELDFSEDLFAEPLIGPWFRLGARTINIETFSELTASVFNFGRIPRGCLDNLRLVLRAPLRRVSWRSSRQPSSSSGVSANQHLASVLPDLGDFPANRVRELSHPAVNSPIDLNSATHSWTGWTSPKLGSSVVNRKRQVGPGESQTTFFV